MRIDPGGRRAVAARLAAAGCVAADDEAEELLSFAPDDATLDAWTARRERGEPLAWITGRHQFAGTWLHMAPDVYVPRLQTEELVARAASLVGDGRLADLCTGCGAVAAGVRVAAPGSSAVGVDIDRRALGCARRNGVPVVVGDLGAPLRDGVFDVVTAVAPYVPTPALPLLPRDVVAYEPLGALAGGADGLDVVRRVVEHAARLLRRGGWLLVELGGEQDRLLEPALARFGFGEPARWCDDEGDLRGLAAPFRRGPGTP